MKKHTKICELCGKEFETDKEKPNFNFGGKEWACQKCIDEFEEGMDRSNLYCIVERRGKQWVKEKIDELVSIKSSI